MGNKCGVSKRERKEWQERYGIPKDKVETTFDNFNEQADEDGKISKKSFVDIMAAAAGTEPEFAERVFDSFDVDESGKMDIREYMALMGVSHGGTIEERLEYSFRLFDKDNNKHLDKKEVTSMLQMVTLSVLKKRAIEEPEITEMILVKGSLPEALIDQIDEMVVQLFDVVDTDKSGTIEVEEFKEGFKKHPKICKFFNQF